MICINCANQKTKVTNSRTHKGASKVWRRRRCVECSCTFTTYERVSISDEIIVEDPQGKKIAFHPGKLMYSIVNCFHHSPEKAPGALWLLETIESQLLKKSNLTLDVYEIAHITHQTLLSFDKLAGEQYAVRHRKSLSKK